MIPWVREKFAERRARWIASRKRTDSSSSGGASNGSSGGGGSGGIGIIGPAAGSIITSSTASSSSSPSSLNYNNNCNTENCDSRNNSSAAVATTTTVAAGSASTTVNNSNSNSSRRILIEQQKQKQQQQQQLQRSQQNNNLSSIKLTTKLKSGELNNQKRAQQNDDENDGVKINVKILSPNGKQIIISTLTTAKIVDLLQESIQKFAQESPDALPVYDKDLTQLYTKYRFIRTDLKLIYKFTEDLTLEQSDIGNNDTLLLRLKRTTQTTTATTIGGSGGGTGMITSDDIAMLRGPTSTDIALATLNQPQNEPKPKRTEITDLISRSDLQFDVRKVIVSLAQSSAYIIGCGPYAAQLIAMFKQKLINKQKLQYDTLQCLVDMGFTREKAAYALKIQNGIYSAALEWLIEHQNDDHNSGTNNDVETNQQATTAITTTDAAENENFPSTILATFLPPNIPETDDCAGNIRALLEIVRIYSQRDIPPPTQIVQALMDMGFQEKAIIEALRLTHNNQSAACEWLCGNRNTSLTELRDGLSQESPILKAIMFSPLVQMSLSNPKMFIAYLSMLEDHNALTMWLNDTDTSSVLSHILRRYHEEKHILGINQFNSNSNTNTDINE